MSKKPLITYLVITLLCLFGSLLVWNTDSKIKGIKLLFLMLVGYMSFLLFLGESKRLSQKRRKK